MKRWQAVILLFLFSLGLGAAKSLAQVPTGQPPFGSFGGGPDVINLENLNVELSIPTVAKAGVGLPFDYGLAYNSSIWYPVSNGISKSWQPVTTRPAYNYWGWQGILTGGVPLVSYSLLTSPSSCQNQLGQNQSYTVYLFSKFIYTDPDGTRHPFFATNGPSYNQVPAPGGGQCPPNGSNPATVSALNTDDSGLTMYVTPGAGTASAYLVTRDGTTVNAVVLQSGGAQGQWSESDRNGNSFSNSSGVYTDTLGTTALTVAGTPPSNTVLTYTGPSGSVSYTVKYTSYTVQTNFACSGISEWGPYAESLVSEVDLPDGSKYTFTYEPTPGYSGNVTGQLAQVTLPTGGTIAYSYFGGCNGMANGGLGPDGSAAGFTRTVTPGGSEPAGTWRYSRSYFNGTWTTTVSDPAANHTTINFPYGVYETERQVNQGSSTLLETVYTCYGGTAPLNCGQPASFPITKRGVFTELPVGSTTLESETYTTYNSYGLPTEVDDYGYGNGAVGTELRSVVTTYANGNSCGVTNPNVVSVPCSVAVQEGGLQTTYSYDANGNQLSQTAGGLTRNSTYNTNGTVATATDVNTAQTSYAYASGSCNGAFPTSTSLPLNLSESSGWSCNGAVGMSSTDANGQATTITYDDPDFWRPAQTTFPDGGWKAFAYPSLTETDTYTGITNSTPSTNCANGCREDRTLLDGLARQMERLLASDPDGVTTTTTTYDPANSQTDVTNPDRTGAGTNGTTVSTYDAMSRTISVQRPDGSTA